MSLLYNASGEVYEIEYIEILKNRKTILHLSGAEANGLRKADLQKIIGEKCGAGMFGYSAKSFKSDKVESGRIRSINPDMKEAILTNDDSDLLKKINELESKINQKSESLGLNTILELTKNSYDFKIKFMEEKISDLKKEIEKLEAEIDRGQVEINKLYSIIEDLKGKSSSGIDQMLKMMSGFMPGNKNKLSEASGEVNENGIPAEFKKTLGEVNWNEVSEDQKKQFVGIFNNIKSALPLNK